MPPPSPKNRVRKKSQSPAAEVRRKTTIPNKSSGMEAMQFRPVRRNNSLTDKNRSKFSITSSTGTPSVKQPNGIPRTNQTNGTLGTFRSKVSFKTNLGTNRANDISNINQSYGNSGTNLLNEVEKAASDAPEGQTIRKKILKTIRKVALNS